jgi:DMSO reductase anchor subunit
VRAVLPQRGHPHHRGGGDAGHRSGAGQRLSARRAQPGAHPADHTTYRSKKELPRNLLPADFYAVNAEKPHPPLVWMLVLTQLSVGAFCVLLACGTFAATSAAVALALGLVALGTSVLHLGRPLYAFRALLGLRTSWLSREIVAFSLFAGLAGLYAASLRLPVAAALRLPLLRATAGAGVLAVLCSVMVYEATRRPTWRAHITGFKFLATSAVLGTATVLMLDPGPGVAHALQLATLIKLVGEGLGFRHLKSRRHTALKRSALLQANDFDRLTLFRFGAGAIGGLVLPIFPVPWMGVPIFVLLLAGELAERYLFFVTASAARMPGAPA